jgi:hypothetical protein
MNKRLLFFLSLLTLTMTGWAASRATAGAVSNTVGPAMPTTGFSDNSVGTRPWLYPGSWSIYTPLGSPEKKATGK